MLLLLRVWQEAKGSWGGGEVEAIAYREMGRKRELRYLISAEYLSMRGLLRTISFARQTSRVETLAKVQATIVAAAANPLKKLNDYMQYRKFNKALEVRRADGRLLLMWLII